MKIGIVEICEPNHYSAVLALAQTYAVKSENSITIYTLSAFSKLFGNLPGNIHVDIKPEQETVKSFLTHIAVAGLNRVHINTISAHYGSFAAVKWSGEVYFTVHNTDLFFANTLGHRARLLKDDLGEALQKRSWPGIKSTIVQFVKDFKRQAQRQVFINRLLSVNYRIIVYSHSQKKHLIQYVPEDRIIVFPFCLYDGMTDNSAANKKLRLCIPGTVTNRRRDYSSLLHMINTHFAFFKENITLDMLGYIYKDENTLREQAEALQKKGFDIIFNTGFIATDEFNTRLSMADVILGNLKVQVNAYRKYGVTKETGVIFNIIKSGKPGILPHEYTTDAELKDICLFYNNYADLLKIIEQLVAQKEKTEALKIKAQQVAGQYTPEKLYNLLAN